VGRMLLMGNEYEGSCNCSTTCLCHVERHDTHGTRLVWNSLRSTFNEPSKRSEAVIDETT